MACTSRLTIHLARACSGPGRGRSKWPGLLALLGAVLTTALPCRAQDCISEPYAEWQTWVGVGAGAADGSPLPSPHYELTAGGSVGLPLNVVGTFRVGPWLSLGTSTVSWLHGLGGLEVRLLDVFVPDVRPGAFSQDTELNLQVGSGYALVDGRSGVAAFSASLGFGFREDFSGVTHTIAGFPAYCPDPVLWTDPDTGQQTLRDTAGHTYTRVLRGFVRWMAMPKADVAWVVTFGVEIDAPFLLGLSW